MKRLFFGMRTTAPWPEAYPRGRLLAEEARHFTLVFLGDQEEEKIISSLANMPEYPLPLGSAGYFDRCLMLPPRHPHVVAWHPDLGEDEGPLKQYAKELSEFFEIKGREDWLPHVTIAREPFFSEEWEKSFAPLPCMTTSLDLFESVGNLHYESLWQKKLIPPIEKLPHTADIAFLVRGTDYAQLFEDGRIALAFEDPRMLACKSARDTFLNLDDVIMGLNELIAEADIEFGSSFKAVSYHGEAKPVGKYLEWEMIVDV